jgi:hypothetical protein
MVTFIPVNHPTVFSSRQSDINVAQAVVRLISNPKLSCLNLHTGLKAHVIELPPVVCLHHINAYEVSGSSSIVLDTTIQTQLDFSTPVNQMNASSFEKGTHPQPARIIADMSTGESSVRLLSHRGISSLAINPSRVGKVHKYIYAAASSVDDERCSGPSQVVLKMTMPEVSAETPASPYDQAMGAEVWSPGPRCFTQVGTHTVAMEVQHRFLLLFLCFYILCSQYSHRCGETGRSAPKGKT